MMVLEKPHRVIASARNSGVSRFLDMDTSPKTLIITRSGVYKTRGSPLLEPDVLFAQDVTDADPVGVPADADVCYPNASFGYAQFSTLRLRISRER